MDIAATLGVAAGGVLVGWLGTQLWAARRHAGVQADLAATQARLDEMAKSLASLQAELTTERNHAARLVADLASAETVGNHLEARLTEEAGRLATIQAQFHTQFENLANRILEEKSAKFLSQNHSHLSTLLDPLRQRIGEFRDRVESIHTEDIQTSAALREQLGQLKDLNRQLSDEAGALTRALKGESKTQGTWGELVLERILEKSGLKKGVEYDTQAHFRSESGEGFFPDVVIHLPDNHHLVVDAKVSLTAYERAVNATSDPERHDALREHTSSVRRHVEALSRKDYPNLPALQSPDFVLMFVPVEPALHLALEQDTALFSDAFERNVVLVSSTTLLVTLRAIESVWRRQKQTLNALEIARQAGNLHDQFVLFIESLQDIGQRLDQARASYDQSLARLSTGRGNLIRRTLELQKLGARTEKQIAAPLAQKAQEDGETENSSGPENGDAADRT